MSVIDASSGKPHARREQRFPIDLAAIVRGEGRDLPVRLKNLSRGGAFGECLRPPAVASEVVLVRGALTVEARVAWIGCCCFGLQFARQIRATELLVQLSLSRTALA